MWSNLKEIAAWKWISIHLILSSIVFGILGPVPRLPILNESIRNLYYHVPMWFAMVSMASVSAWHGIRYLQTSDIKFDRLSYSYTSTAVLFGILGLCTGSLWARFTWGAFWTNDPKLNSAAIGLLMYLAYMVLRGAFEDDILRARISSVYNIFAFVVFVPLIFILPRLTDSLHPGNGGNPGFNSYDLNQQMRFVFYPAVIGWIMLGVWLATLTYRIEVISYARDTNNQIK